MAVVIPVGYPGGGWVELTASDTIPLANVPAGITESLLSFSDVTTLNVSTSRHGFVPKAPNDTTKFLDGTGAYAVPSGSASVLSTELTAYGMSYVIAAQLTLYGY